MSLRLTSEVEERLTKVAEKVKLTKNALAQAAIEAAVEAIEATGTLVLPITFSTTHVAVKRSDVFTNIVPLHEHELEGAAESDKDKGPKMKQSVEYKIPRKRSSSKPSGDPIQDAIDREVAEIEALGNEDEQAPGTGNATA